MILQRGKTSYNMRRYRKIFLSSSRIAMSLIYWPPFISKNPILHGQKRTRFPPQRKRTHNSHAPSTLDHPDISFCLFYRPFRDFMGTPRLSRWHYRSLWECALLGMTISFLDHISHIYSPRLDQRWARSLHHHRLSSDRDRSNIGTLSNGEWVFSRSCSGGKCTYRRDTPNTFRILRCSYPYSEWIFEYGDSICSRSNRKCSTHQ